MRYLKCSHFKRQNNIKISQKLCERERDVISDTDVTFFIMTFALIHVKEPDRIVSAAAGVMCAFAWITVSHEDS